MFVVDVPAIAISDNCRNGFDPAFSRARLGGRDAEPANPDLILLDCVLGQYPRPTLHRLIPFLEASRHVWVRDPYRSWDQSCDETRARSTRRSSDLYPTLDSVTKDRGGVPRVVERPYGHEPE